MVTTRRFINDAPLSIINQSRRMDEVCSDASTDTIGLSNCTTTVEAMVDWLNMNQMRSKPANEPLLYSVGGRYCHVVTKWISTTAACSLPACRADSNQDNVETKWRSCRQIDKMITRSWNHAQLRLRQLSFINISRWIDETMSSWQRR